jgi:hypothetical protein
MQEEAEKALHAVRKHVFDIRNNFYKAMEEGKQGLSWPHSLSLLDDQLRLIDCIAELQQIISKLKGEQK